MKKEECEMKCVCIYVCMYTQIHRNGRRENFELEYRSRCYTSLVARLILFLPSTSSRKKRDDTPRGSTCIVDNKIVPLIDRGTRTGSIVIKRWYAYRPTPNFFRSSTGGHCRSDTWYTGRVARREVFFFFFLPRCKLIVNRSYAKR